MAETFLLDIFPKGSVFDPTQRDLIEAIPRGKFYLLAPFVVPFSSLPQKFVVQTDAWDKVITVKVNDQVQFQGVPLSSGSIFKAPHDPRGFHMNVEVPLMMDHGENIVSVSVEGTPQVAEIFVVSSSIITLIKSYASTFFKDLLYPLQQQRQSLLSPWSPKAVENLIEFQENIPDLRIPRTHAVKLIMRAMMANSGTTRGVLDFATGITYNTPIIKEITNKNFLKLDYHLKLKQDALFGHNFHMWIPSKDVVHWLAFTKLIENLPDTYKLLVDGFADVFIDAEADVKRLEQHIFTQDRMGPDLWGIIKSLPRLKIAVHPSRFAVKNIGSYIYRYRIAEKVLYPLGDHILGRRPRHMGAIEADITFSGTTTTTVTSNLEAASIVEDTWGVNPDTLSKLDAIRLANDKDTTYIAHSKGGNAIQSFRFDVSSIPDDAIILRTTLNVVARGLGSSPRLTLVASRARTKTVFSLENVVPSAYTTLNANLPGDPITGSMPTKTQLSSIAFGVRDDSLGNAIVRVTEMSIEIEWARPLHLRIMDTDFRFNPPSGTTANQIADMVRTRIASVANLLKLTVGGTSPTVNIEYVPFFDKDGKIIHLELIDTPPGLSIEFTSIRGHTLSTNDGVDQWSQNQHDPITVTLTNPLPLRRINLGTGDAVGGGFWQFALAGFSGSDVGRFLRVSGTATSDGEYLISQILSPALIVTATAPSANETFSAGTFNIFPGDYVRKKTFKPEIGFLGHSLNSTRLADGHQRSSISPPANAYAKFGTMSGYFRLGQIRMPGPQAVDLIETLTEHVPNV